MRLELVMQTQVRAVPNAVVVAATGLGNAADHVTFLSTRDAMRLARAIRNLVKEELAAIDAANNGDQGR